MAKIVSLDFKDNNIFISTNQHNGSSIPCFCKRIVSNVWQYHCGYYVFNRADNNCIGCLDKIVDDINCDVINTYDILMYDEDTETESQLQFDESVQFECYDFDVLIDIGTISFEFYRNGSNGLSLRAKLKYAAYCLLKVEETDYKVTLRIGFDKPMSLMLARRATKHHDYSYDVKFIVPIVPCAKGYIANINKKDLLPYCQHHHEIWDWVAVCNNRFVPCVYNANSDLNNTFAISDAFNVQLKSVDSYASIVTFEGLNESQKKINVAILGSCFSKEAFHSVDYMNPDYKRFYNNSLLGFHQSIIAVESNPVEYNISMFDGRFEKEIKKYGDMAFSKTFMELLRTTSPDYLIIDLYIEAAATVFEAQNQGFVTESYYVGDTSAFKKMDVKHKYKIGSNIRYELFKNSVDKFIAQLKDIIPENDIIIIRAQAAFEKVENGIISQWPEQQFIEFQRKLWERNDNYLISKLPNARIIDMRDDKYRSMRIGTLAFSRNHLVHEYYVDLLNNVNKIVLQDMLKQK